MLCACCKTSAPLRCVYAGDINIISYLLGTGVSLLSCYTKSSATGCPDRDACCEHGCCNERILWRHGRGHVSPSQGLTGLVLLLVAQKRVLGSPSDIGNHVALRAGGHRTTDCAGQTPGSLAIAPTDWEDAAIRRPLWLPGSCPDCHLRHGIQV